MKGRLGKALLLVSSLVFACGVAEVALRIAGWGPIYDVYSKPELFWRHDDRLGWSLEPGARGRYIGPRPFPIEFESSIQINSLGLRGPEPRPRQPGELRVLVLGDSMVAGFEVEQEDTFSALLERRLRRRFSEPITVINGGVRGYGNDQTLLWYRERGFALGADLVFLVFSENDFEDNATLHRARRPFGKGAFALRDGGRLEPIGIPVPHHEMCSSWVLDTRYEPARIDGPLNRVACWIQTRGADHSALFTATSEVLARVPGLVKLLKDAGQAEPSRAAQAGIFGASSAPTAASAEQRGALTSAILQALVWEVRRSGARFFVVILPRHWQRLETHLEADRIVAHAVQLPPSVDPSQIHFRNDSHFNELGHRVFAEGLLPLAETELRVVRGSRPAAPAGPGAAPAR